MSDPRDDDAPTALVYPQAPWRYDYDGDLVPGDCASDDDSGEWCDDPLPREWGHAPHDTDDELRFDPDPVARDELPF